MRKSVMDFPVGTKFVFNDGSSWLRSLSGITNMRMDGYTGTDHAIPNDSRGSWLVGSNMKVILPKQAIINEFYTEC